MIGAARMLIGGQIPFVPAWYLPTSATDGNDGTYSSPWVNTGLAIDTGTDSPIGNFGTQAVQSGSMINIAGLPALNGNSLICSFPAALCDQIGIWANLGNSNSTEVDVYSGGTWTGTGMTLVNVSWTTFTLGSPRTISGIRVYFIYPGGNPQSVDPYLAAIANVAYHRIA